MKKFIILLAFLPFFTARSSLSSRLATISSRLPRRTFRILRAKMTNLHSWRVYWRMPMSCCPSLMDLCLTWPLTIVSPMMKPMAID